jgi:hypothetical protein
MQTSQIEMFFFAERSSCNSHCVNPLAVEEFFSEDTCTIAQSNHMVVVL